MSAPRFTKPELNAINVALDGLRESLSDEMLDHSAKDNEEIDIQSEVDPEEYCSFRGSSYVTHDIAEALSELEEDN